MGNLCIERPSDLQADRRILITGATGLLGREARRKFADAGWTVEGCGFSRAEQHHVQRIDLFNGEEFPDLLDSFRPSVVLHCAAERRPDKLEGDEKQALAINADLPRRIAIFCAQRGIWLIHLSTNYVFDGTAAPYEEHAQAKPLSTYGRSKLEGEKAIIEVNPQAAIIRVPLLFGPIEFVGETSVTALLDTVKQEAPKFDDWQERFPTSSVDLACVLEAFASAYAERGAADPKAFSGLFHWQSNERHTKYTMACIIAKIAGIDSSKFVRIDTAPPPGSAPRPQFERMLCNRLERVLEIEDRPKEFRTTFESAVQDSLLPFLNNT